MTLSNLTASFRPSVFGGGNGSSASGSTWGRWQRSGVTHLACTRKSSLRASLQSRRGWKDAGVVRGRGNGGGKRQRQGSNRRTLLFSPGTTTGSRCREREKREREAEDGVGRGGQARRWWGREGEGNAECRSFLFPIGG